MGKLMFSISFAVIVAFEFREVINMFYIRSASFKEIIRFMSYLAAFIYLFVYISIKSVCAMNPVLQL